MLPVSALGSIVAVPSPTGERPIRRIPGVSINLFELNSGSIVSGEAEAVQFAICLAERGPSRDGCACPAAGQAPLPRALLPLGLHPALVIASLEGAGVCSVVRPTMPLVGHAEPGLFV